MEIWGNGITSTKCSKDRASEGEQSQCGGSCEEATVPGGEAPGGVVGGEDWRRREVDREDEAGHWKDSDFYSL